MLAAVLAAAYSQWLVKLYREERRSAVVKPGEKK
jgi:hypothetical protein